MTGDTRTRADVFRHEALLYAGDADFVERTVPFLRAGVAGGEAVLVVVPARKIELLRDALGRDARGVQFADMAHVGHNPARIIPAWRDFIAGHGGSGLARGVGEPIWAGRSPAELVESQRHEALLNLAFAGTPAFELLCPYDVDALDPAVIEEAYRSHPYLVDGGGLRSSGHYGEPSLADLPLPEPRVPVEEIGFDASHLDAVRRLVATYAGRHGLDPDRTADLLLAAHEVATNTVRHGGGHGTARAWAEGDALVCEIRDGGHITEPLAGRVRPPAHQEGGRGLWIINQLCDLVQVRTGPQGTVIRLHVTRH